MSLKYGYSKRAELKARREDPLIVRVGKCNSPPHCLSASEEAEAEARWQQLRQQHKRLSELEKSHRGIDTSSSPSLVRDLNERSDSSSSGGSSSSDSSSDSSSGSSSSSSRSKDNDNGIIIREDRDRDDDVKNGVVNVVRNGDVNVRSEDVMNGRNTDGGGIGSYGCYRSSSPSKHCVVRY